MSYSQNLLLHFKFLFLFDCASFLTYTLLRLNPDNHQANGIS